MKHPALIYRQFSVQGATPLGLVVMLYDGAIAFMHRAVAAMEAHDIPKKCNHLNRALAIIAQLEGTLDFEQGGEVARTLKSFYVYARTQALKANIENSPEILRSLIEKFSTVREAWYEADHRPSPSVTTPASEASPSAPSPTPKSGSWQVTAVEG
jgi:flagellar protein FliS